MTLQPNSGSHRFIIYIIHVYTCMYTCTCALPVDSFSISILVIRIQLSSVLYAVNVDNNFFYYTCISSGLLGGEENGRRGYQMTFSVAYIRVRCDIV